MVVNQVVIYGERCSGTNYLEKLLLENFYNFKIIKHKYGWKHFPKYSDLNNYNTKDILFIGIIRNLPDWVNSLYRNKYHLPKELTKDVNSYLNNQVYSLYENSTKEIMEDRNIETGNRYKNIFELRHIKNKYLVDIMPTLVKNYCLITYDNLITNFEDVMNNFKLYLQFKNNIQFPVNIYKNIKEDNMVFKKKQNQIPNNLIIPKADLTYEKILFPIWYKMINEEYKTNHILY